MSALSYVHDGRDCLGFSLGRGKLGFEGFDREAPSLGVFKTAPEAANAVANAASNEQEAG